MSNEVFPTLPGIKWGIEKEPEFSTRVVRAVSGYEVRLAERAYPTYQIKLSFEFLRSAAAYLELQAVVGLFLRHQGQCDSFLLLDASDYQATNQSFGTGDGVNKIFSLVSTWGGFVQPVRNIKTIGSITVNGTATSAYTIGTTGLITFTAAPALGAVLRWTGEYYHRCRFADDTLSPRQFMQDIWELNKCDLVGALGNQIG